MKKSLILIVVCLFILCCSASSWAYSDTQGLNTTTQQAIESLSEQGVFNGYSDGSFRPEQYVNRAEFAKICCLLAGYQKSAVSTSPFPDVAVGQWYDGWVATAADQQLIKGYGDGSFCPAKTISQQELLTVLVRMSGIDVTNFSWPQDYLTTAVSLGFTDGITLKPTAAVSRATCALMAANWLTSLDNQEPETSNTYGIIVSIASDRVSIFTADGQTAHYDCSTAQIPANTLPGSFVEATVVDGAISKVIQLISPLKGTESWDISYGKLEIDGTYYDISSTVFIGAKFAINKQYSADSFLGPIVGDNAKIAAAKTIYGDQLVVVKVNGSNVVYMVNSGLHIGSAYGVIDEIFYGADGRCLSFISDTDNSLKLSDNGAEVAAIIDGYDSGAYNCCFVQYTLSDDDGVEITEAPLFVINNGVRRLSTEALDLSNFDDSWYWVLSNGSVSVTCSNVASVTAQVADKSSSSVTIGNSIYNIGVISDIYIIGSDGIVSSGSIRDISDGQEIISIVNDENDVLWLFCFE